MQSIADIRKEYKLQVLDEHLAEKNALDQFDKWWSDAISSGIEEVNACTLATANAAGKPSARIVLLKGYDADGFVFFTNYESHKGKELAVNPYACMVFFWKELERQVRIEGTVKKISEGESNAYFNSRPQGSRIGAWASPQSQIIESRKIIEENAAMFEAKFEGSTIARPACWGGYCLQPAMIEFWQGRPSRLHDRLQYNKEPNGWKMLRLAP